jgi:hypothetical protein
MKGQHIQPGAHRKVGDELDLLEPDAQMPQAWEAWEVYQFKKPTFGAMCSKIFVVGGRVLPKERISVGESTVNYDTNFAACRSGGRGRSSGRLHASQRVLPEFCTNKDAAASARLDARVVYHPIAFLKERSPALSARC